MFHQSAVAITVGQRSLCLVCRVSNVMHAAQLALELTHLGRTDERVEEDLEKQCSLRNRGWSMDLSSS